MSETAVLSVAAIQSGTLSAEMATQRCLDRIARYDGVLGAFTCLNPSAGEDARQSDARRASGQTLSPIDGVPVAIKDNMLVRGLRATWGSAVYADYVPDHDELPVARLRAAGAVIIGKTNTPTFAARGYTDNALFGPSRNPWNPALTPGGSSGGSAAAVAAGLVPIALGTDGGGSTRRPAAHNGILGLKPSIGRIPRGDGLPAILHDLEVVGLLARTSADLRALTQVLAARERLDALSRRFEPIGAHRSAPSLRIRLIETFGSHPVDPQIAAAIRVAADHLAAMGHVVTTGAFAADFDSIMALQGVISDAGFAMLSERKPTFEALAPAEFVEQARRGRGISAGKLMAALEDLASLRGAVGQWFADTDLIMTPCTAAQPWPAEVVYPDHIAGQPVGPRGHAVFTGWVNACGHPAISIPIDPDSDGMPIGMQLIADLGRDDLLLDLAADYEAVHPWSHRVPEPLAR